MRGPDKKEMEFFLLIVLIGVPFVYYAIRTMLALLGRSADALGVWPALPALPYGEILNDKCYMSHAAERLSRQENTPPSQGIYPFSGICRFGSSSTLGARLKRARNSGIVIAGAIGVEFG